MYFNCYVSHSMDFIYRNCFTFNSKLIKLIEKKMTFSLKPLDRIIWFSSQITVPALKRVVHIICLLYKLGVIKWCPADRFYSARRRG